MSKCATAPARGSSGICGARANGAALEREDGLHVTHVVGVAAGRFEYRRFIAKFWVRDQRAETVETDLSVADMPMSIASGAEFDLCIVEVEHQNASHADLALRPVDEPVDALGRIDAISSRPRVRRIQTNSELWMVDGANDRSEFFQGPTGKVSGAGRVFQHQIHVRRDVVQTAFQPGRDGVQSLGTIARSIRAEMRVDEAHAAAPCYI